MHVKRLTTHNHDEFGAAMELYRISFPTHEQRAPHSQSAIMGHGEYHFALLYDEGTWVGLMLYWETETFLYVEHFCIRPEMRNRQYGEKALALLGEAGKKVILEIDPPEDEVSLRRKGFYKRAGYQSNGFAHVHPPYHEGVEGHRLVVMSSPRPLSGAEYQGFYDYLRHVVMDV